MANTIRIKRRASGGAAGAPATLAPAELAYSEVDNILYYGFGDAGGGVSSSVVSIAGSGVFVTTTTTQTVSGAKTFSNITITGGSISGITDLAVADGGTGASTASGARSNLSAAASGSNSDITSLTGLTTALSVAQGGTGATTAATARANLLPTYAGNAGKVILVNAGATDIEYVTPNPGTVISIGMTVPNIMSVSGSPITSTGTLAVTLTTQTANYVWAGPTTGSPANPAFRALVSTDIPSLSYLPLSGGTVSGALTVTGDLTVSGTTTTVNSSTLVVADKNIELAYGSTTEAAATGGGITLHGLTDHTIIYTTGTSSWDFSEHVNLVTGKAFKINGTTVLTATALDGVSVDGGTF